MRDYRTCLLLLVTLVPLLFGGAAGEGAALLRGTVQLRDGIVDPADVRIVLNERGAGGVVKQRSTFLVVPEWYYDDRRATGDGEQPAPQGDFEFEFAAVSEGTHTLDVLAMGLAFPQVRHPSSLSIQPVTSSTVPNERTNDRTCRVQQIRIQSGLESGEGARASIAWSLVSHPKKIFRGPLRVRPLGALRYFDARTSFDPIRLAKANPIMALMAVMSLVVLFMPKVRPPRPTNACGGSAPTHATDKPDRLLLRVAALGADGQGATRADAEGGRPTLAIIHH